MSTRRYSRSSVRVPRTRLLVGQQLVAYDGVVMFCAIEDGVIAINSQNEVVLRAYNGHSAGVLAICAIPGLLYSCSADCTWRAWNMKTASPIVTVDTPGPAVFVKVTSRFVYVYDTLSLMQYTLKEHALTNTLLLVNSTNAIVVTDTTICSAALGGARAEIYDAHTLRRARIFSHSGMKIVMVCEGPSTSVLLMSRGMNTPMRITAFNQHGLSIFNFDVDAYITPSVALPFDGGVVFGANQSWFTCLFADEVAKEYHFPAIDDAVDCVAFSATQDRLVLGGREGRVYTVPAVNGVLLADAITEFDAPSATAGGVRSISMRGSCIHALHWRELVTWDMITSLHRAVRGPVSSVDAFVVTDQHVYSTSSFHCVSVWARDYGVPIATLPATAPVNALLVLQNVGTDKTMICGVTMDCKLILWDPEEGTIAGMWKTPGLVTCVAAHDRTVICGTVRNELQTFDVEHQKTTDSEHRFSTLAKFATSRSPLLTVVYSHEHQGQRVVIAAGLIDYVSVFDFPSGDHITSMPVEAERVHCVEAAGDTVFIGTANAVINVWNWKTREPMWVLALHKGPVMAMDYVDGWLYSGSTDATVVEWHVAEGKKPEMKLQFDVHLDSVSQLHVDGNQLFSSSTVIIKTNMAFYRYFGIYLRTPFDMLKGAQVADQDNEDFALPLHDMETLRVDSSARPRSDSNSSSASTVLSWMAAASAPVHEEALGLAKGHGQTYGSLYAFIMTVILQIVNTLQIWAFTFQADFLWNKPEITSAVERAQRLGMGELGYVEQVASAWCMTALLLSAMKGGEWIERLSFLDPRSSLKFVLWQLVRILCVLLASPAFIQIVGILVATYNCVEHGGTLVFAHDLAHLCWSKDHVAFILASSAALVVYIPASARLIIADSDLANIEVVLNPFDWSRDGSSTRLAGHPLSKRGVESTRHQAITLVVKLLLVSGVSLAGSLSTRLTFQLALGFFNLGNTLYNRPFKSYVANCILCAADCLILLSFGGAAVVTLYDNSDAVSPLLLGLAPFVGILGFVMMFAHQWKIINLTPSVVFKDELTDSDVGAEDTDGNVALIRSVVDPAHTTSHGGASVSAV